MRYEKTRLLLSYVKPYNAVSKDTLARWVKTVLSRAGIDITKFSAHSTRSASTSAAKIRGVPLEIIMNRAGWCRPSTFAKYYNKPVQTQDSFAKGLLSTFSVKQN